MPRCSSSPAANAASGAERTDQERCVSERSAPRCSSRSCSSSSPSAAPVLAAAVALITALAAIEVFRLLRGAGYAPFAALGTALALVVVLDAAVPRVLEGSGLLLVAVGIVLTAVAAFTKTDPTDGLQAWMATVFGALYVSLLAFVIRLGDGRAGDPRRLRRSSPIGAERGWILLLILAVWSFDTGAYLVGKNIGADQFLTHISPAKTVEGVVGGVVATTVVVALMLWAARPEPAPRARARAADRAGRPGRRPRRIGHQAGRRRQGLGHPDPGPRRDARPGRFVPVRGAGRDPVCRRPHPLTPSGQGTGRARRVALLGSTGSIGRQTVDVLAAHPDAFRVVALATGSNAGAAGRAGRAPPARRGRARRRRGARRLDLPPGTERVGGADALEALATRDDVDLVVVGDRRRREPPAGPRRAAGRQGRRDGQQGDARRRRPPGDAARPRARPPRRGRRRPGDPYASPLAWLRPIDSEHSAIWQCLVGESMAGVAALILTASGGPFLDATPRTLAAVTPAQALRHPTWTMGAKITIDSATLANKGLEVIEAHWLYDVGYDAIEVVIHPQSVVHSAVRFVDGSLKAQLGTPDMRLPIQYALTYPDRRPSPAAPPDLIAAGRLDFRAPGRDALPGPAHRPRGRAGSGRAPRPR